ncbi:Hypothetical_protein [Hexamita inflata]|uniref:Hypothetical_protein n=1 Tax=Hexamita inflata TaxID=28002 RepID=A0AA86R535_9EUKA|nr:Hypothetical protein HINF_LOCUS47044 [Hexamita inflata]CAI9969517.1 Hypothetical protein HINF_LOCUS57162 [Hexamita inflata]
MSEAEKIIAYHKDLEEIFGIKVGDFQSKPPRQAVKKDDAKEQIEEAEKVVSYYKDLEVVFGAKVGDWQRDVPRVNAVIVDSLAKTGELLITIDPVLDEEELSIEQRDT